MAPAMSATVHTSTTATTTTSSQPTCHTAIPGKYGYVPESACNSNYNYPPVYGAAVAFSVLFALVFTTHLILAFIHRKRYCWVVLMATSWWLVSFITNALGAHNQQSSGLATASLLLLLLAPLWLNAFVYMTLGRMVHYFLPKSKLLGLRAAVIGRYFVLGDITAFIIQAIGGLMTTPGTSASTEKIGLDIYMAGIGLQQAFICIFIAFSITFWLRMAEAERLGQATRKSSWRLLWFALIAVLAFIAMRIIYRLVEYSRGLHPKTNPLPFHAVYMYALDATPMLIASTILAVIHPGLVLKGSESEFPHFTRQQKKERKALRRAEKEQRRAGNKLVEEGFQNGDESHSMAEIEQRSVQPYSHHQPTH